RVRRGRSASSDGLRHRSTKSAAALPLQCSPTCLERSLNSRVRRRHQRECKALRNVSSLAIVKVLADGEHPAPTIAAAGWLWTAFELVDRPHLKHVMSLKPVGTEMIVA